MPQFYDPKKITIFGTKIEIPSREPPTHPGTIGHGKSWIAIMTSDHHNIGFDVTKAEDFKARSNNMLQGYWNSMEIYEIDTEQLSLCYSQRTCVGAAVAAPSPPGNP